MEHDNLCKQCFCHIAPAHSWKDQIAQKRGFCCFGCMEVYYELRRMWKLSA